MTELRTVCPPQGMLFFRERNAHDRGFTRNRTNPTSAAACLGAGGKGQNLFEPRFSAERRLSFRGLARCDFSYR